MNAMPETEIDLAAIDAKLDYLVGRHKMLEELIRELTPVAREALRVGAERLAAWEQQGLFELLAALGDRAVPLLRTLANLTEPDVLAVANDAGEVIHHASQLPPVGVVGAVRAASEPDVQHGLAVALEVLRHLGQARAAALAPVAIPIPGGGAPQAAAPAPIAQPPEVLRPARASTGAAATERVSWEGATFTGDGFLVDPAEWSEPLARKMAAALGLALTDDHWAVLRWVRQDWATTGASPNVRRTASGSGVGTRRMYELFPQTPGKTAARLAGVPKPVGCI